MRKGFAFTLVASCAAFCNAQPIEITVNGTPSVGRSSQISPLIYGVNFATSAQAAALNLPLNRSGGNATTRYNWQSDATSSGSDWYFLTHATGGGPSQSIDDWVTANRSSGVIGGTQSMITIPIMGWVAKLTATGGWTWSFSVAKYGAQQQSEPGRPDAGNGVKPNGTHVTGNDPNDANKPVQTSYQQGWLEHLVNRFGTAQNGGVKYYLLDNEPGLWHETHRDVMPANVTMQGLFDRQRDMALLVKSVDPTALVCGPEEWGWLGYLYSGSDFQWLQAHNWQGNPPDRAAHNNMDQAPWLLQQFAAASQTAGKRLLDVFSLHYYPQGSYSWSDNSQAASLWRNRATRSLWDPNYTDESWIGQKINLIPRMKGWVNSYYPGTQIGITEYIWGDDNVISAALAQADALGIFAREGVNLATRWVCPATNSLTFRVFQMYRNYDGNGSTFGDLLGSTITTANPDELAVHTGYATATRRLSVMMINKKLTGTTQVRVIKPNADRSPKAKLYRLTESGGLQQLSDQTGVSGTFILDLPPQSVTLLVMLPGS